MFNVKLTKMLVEMEVQLPPEYTGGLELVELSGNADIDFLGDIPRGNELFLDGFLT